MAPTTLVDDMGVDNVGFLIENLGADAAPLQYVRELVHNEIESIVRAGIADGRIEIDFEEIDGVRKLRITGNGAGMTPDEVQANLNRLSATGGVQAFDKNFGIGAKITAGTRNPQGVIYNCWKDGKGSLTVMGRIDGRYGRLGFAQPDGSVLYSLPLGVESKPSLIDDHGVAVVLLGRDADEDTTLAPPGSDLPSQWVTAYLDRRYFQLPDQISIHVPREILDAERGVRTMYDQVRGQKYYLDKHSDASGTVDLSDVKAKVHWWLLSEEIVKGGKTWSNRGHVAALYQNELHDVHGTHARSSALKDFGIYAGFSRVVLYVEPRNVLKANTARTALILQGNVPVDYAEIGTAFVEHMPDAIAAFMAGQVTTERGDHRKAIRKNLKEVEEELKSARYRRGRRGSPDHFDFEDGGAPAPLSPSPKVSTGAGGAAGTRDASGRVGAEYLRKAEQERERRMRGEQADLDPAPRIVWEKEDATITVGRAASYNPGVHLVTASRHYSFYKDMVEWAFNEAKERAVADMADDALRAIAEDEVQRWFEQALTETVVVLRPLSRNPNWGPDVFRSALSDDGLTAAIVSHRWHMMTAVRRGLSARLGRAPAGAAVAGNVVI